MGFDYEQEHIERLRELAPECVVLLKSDGRFPLPEPCEIALYGSGARHTVKGGTGSGDVNVRHFATAEEGLINAGFIVTSVSWLDAYDKIRQDAWERFASGMRERVVREGVTALLAASGTAMPEPEYELQMDAPGDVAVYVLSRNSGEGADRKAVSGDLLLSSTEVRDILSLQKRYDKFMLILNVGGVVDLSPVVSEVENILLLSQLGMTTGDTLADLLLGKCYPSGKLSTTWAAADDYCEIGSFGEQDDTEYREGVYVGYRYFDTVGKKSIFPFGFGKGYTEFAVSFQMAEVRGFRGLVRAEVKNTGTCPGREVVQLYLSAPGRQIDAPLQSLAAFAKTAELASGEKQEIELAFDLTQLASYAKEQACMVVEQGDYVVCLGASSDHTSPVAILRVGQDIYGPVLPHVGGEPEWADWKPEIRRSLELPNGLPILAVTAENLCFAKAQPPRVSDKAAELAKSLPTEVLIRLCTGTYTDAGSQSVIGNAGMTVAGAAGETVSLPDYGIPSLVMADGPAGLRLSRHYGKDEQGIYSIQEPDDVKKMEMLLPESWLSMLGLGKTIPGDRGGEILEQNCTAIPIGTAIAQSWNPWLAEQCGDIVGAEMERFGIHIWLAPALNIHRNVFCGRNFEYYSEDPCLSGKIAAGIIRGTQAHAGCGVTVKHFVCNNQETNRFQSNSVVSERALREIYMKGFEIAIKEAQPTAVMTSYNLLNGEHTSQREDLCETVLRGEWGFEGFVMSDWVTGTFAGEYKYPAACASGSIKAGNDIMMPGTQRHVDDMTAAFENEEADYALDREILERNAARMMEAAWNLNEGKG